MILSKTRLIYGDVIVLAAIGLLYFATDHFTKNVTAMILVVVVLLARSIFWHVKYYKSNGKIY